MKTIEERAEEYASQYCDGDCALCDDICGRLRSGRSFIAGSESERKELTRWHDPKEELPETDIEVLVTIDAPHNKYDIMKHNQHGWWQKAPGGGWCAAEHAPIGWRHIHEL